MLYFNSAHISLRMMEALHVICNVTRMEGRAQVVVSLNNPKCNVYLDTDRLTRVSRLRIFTGD